MEGHSPTPRLIANTTDVLFDITEEPGLVIDWILDTHDEFIDTRFGGWSAANKSDLAAEMHGTSSNLLVWYNNKADHALPAYINSIHNAMLRAEVGAAKHYGIITFVHPLLLTEEDLLLTSSWQMVGDYGTVLILIAALGFLPSALIPYLIMERANEEKRVQMVR